MTTDQIDIESRGILNLEDNPTAPCAHRHRPKCIIFSC